ncbi:uncharacterized protein LOC118446650 [Vespa mandarinia]|uniref:uncharacterized protein LOC118446650 n=1 Tax=Vespa mandarinia TaxID=7446 RepID=UPI0016153EDD|nr:uncharacterized protein LOC118446650 [Vespa mandarinia]
MSERKLMSTAKLLETSLPTLCFGFCYCNLLLNYRIMKKILYRIKFDWDNLANKPELMILKKYAEISRLCTIVIALSFYFYIVFFIFPSLLSVIQYVFGFINDTELILPIPVEYFMKNLMLYFFALTIEYIIIIIAATVGIANYTMFIAIVQHACALLTIVQWKAIERFLDNRQNFDYTITSRKLIEERQWITDIIEFYNKTIEFIDLLKLFYETIHLLEELLGFIFFLVDYFYLFQLLSLSFNKTEGLTKLLYVIGSLFVLYVYCYLAQKLINHNANVFTIFCQIPFYSLSLKTQNLLLVLIMRSMRPCNLSLRGTIVVSHDLFATLTM